MPLTTSSAGAITIIYSALLTESSTTGHFETHPGILRNKISTQQSTRMELEDSNGVVVVLEDGGSAGAL
jgi:hypothetical protein